jgi:small GTP-binding protein
MFEGRPDRSAEVLFCGRSNVGKSTLLRELTGHDFATGRKPGVTRSPNFYDWHESDFTLTDMPGFGFMKGVPEETREAIKTDIVQYIEAHSEQILVAVLVVDAKSAIDIIDRHSERGEVPHDVELFSFCRELSIPTVVAANKMDKVDDRDARLDALCDRLGLLPPWQQWGDTIAPISAKRGSIDPLTDTIRTHLHEQGRDDLFQFF